MKKVLSNIREFFWPILEKEAVPPIEAESEGDLDLKILDENLEEAFKLKSKILENEEDRRKGIETKASLFISSISLATTIVIAANALISGNQALNIPMKISVAISFILSVYAITTVWFSIKALERGTYHVLDLRDINVAGTKSDYYRHLIKVMQKNVTLNYSTINKKVDYFTLAQEFYKRAIFVIGIYSFVILLFCMFFKKETNTQNSIHIDKVEVTNSNTCDSIMKRLQNLKVVIIDTIPAREQ